MVRLLEMGEDPDRAPRPPLGFFGSGDAAPRGEVQPPLRPPGGAAATATGRSLRRSEAGAGSSPFLRPRPTARPVSTRSGRVLRARPRRAPRSPAATRSAPLQLPRGRRAASQAGGGCPALRRDGGHGLALSAGELGATVWGPWLGCSLTFEGEESRGETPAGSKGQQTSCAGHGQRCGHGAHWRSPRRERIKGREGEQWARPTPRKCLCR